MVTVQCAIGGGDLPVNIEWLLNGSPLTPDLEILTEKRGTRVNILTIDAVSAKHAGNYTCVARNYAGATEHYSSLIVNG